MNLKKFAQLMEGRASLLQSNVNELKKDVAETFITEVANTTPVDVGTAISNWQVGLGDAPTTTLSAHSPGNKGSTWNANVRGTLADATMRIDTALPGEDIHVTNNLDYIDDLEQGYSPQAPDGMVEQAKAKARKKLKGVSLLGRRYVRQY
jgi:hypothetical protein